MKFRTAYATAMLCVKLKEALFTKNQPIYQWDFVKFQFMIHFRWFGLDCKKAELWRVHDNMFTWSISCNMVNYWFVDVMSLHDGNFKQLSWEATTLREQYGAPIPG